MKAVRLRTEQMINPLGIDIEHPLISWNCEDGIRQTAYEVQVYRNDAILWDSPKTPGSTMQVSLPGIFSSRDRIQWRVRLWDEADVPGPWSERAWFEMALLHPDDFAAQWISPEEHTPQGEEIRRRPASWLRKTFSAAGEGNARLYASACGMYEVYLNGQRVGCDVLTPGSDTYRKRIPYQTYDVSAMLHAGNNEIVVIMGDGWFRSCAGVDGERNIFGDDLVLFLQLELNGQLICVSDSSWEASQNGPLRENDMQQGEVYDARMEQITAWHSVRAVEVDHELLRATNSVPVREHERFAGKLMQTPNGETVLDFSQNLAGYVEFSLLAHAGDVITLTHGESLDENGNFTQENFQDRKRHKEGGIRQQVIYTCKEGLNRYKTRFSIWGFRYAKVETSIDLTGAEFTAIAVYSDMEQTGTFSCANDDVNQLFRNSLWSMKSNFCDMPTDCPTRERAAWTGDMAVFADTALYLMNAAPVIRRWLGACRLDQYPDGRIANISPATGKPSFFSELLAASVGWGDACITVPLALYRRYGDIRILKENYRTMQRWYAFLEQRAKTKAEKSPVPGENPYADYTIDSGVDYGEWCEPDVFGPAAMSKPQYKVSTAYYAYSGRLLADIADLLGETQDAAHYRHTAAKAAKAFKHVATDQGRIHSDRQAEYVRAISFGLLEPDETKAAADTLNQMITDHHYHLNTGFLSTPHLCAVLADAGHVKTAYRLLLQDTMPSWLYEVKRGATTIWENWDGINEKGEVKASLNHYSYGAITGWLFAGVCGIRVAGDEITITPRPHPLLEWAEAKYQSPLGIIESSWHYHCDDITYHITIPSNACATFVFPNGEAKKLTAGVWDLSYPCEG